MGPQGLVTRQPLPPAHQEAEARRGTAVAANDGPSPRAAAVVDTGRGGGAGGGFAPHTSQSVKPEPGTRQN